MQGAARQLLFLEILICFTPCSLMLFIGTIMLPMQVSFLFQEPLLWEGPVLMFLAVSCGIAGLLSLIFVVSALSAGKERIENPVAVSAGVFAGAAPLLVQAVLALHPDGDVEWGLWFALVAMPLLATAHILSLSKGLFVEGFRSGQRPLIGTGMRIVTVMIACLAVFLLWLRQGTDYAELKHWRAHWMQHRPAAYSYDPQFAGWIKPGDLLRGRQVRVVGSEVTGASYTFTRGPGDTSEYPPPGENAWTMDDIFNALLDEKKRGSRVSARFDEATGAVLRARVESDLEDASWDIEVHNFRPIDAAAAREPAPMFISYRKQRNRGGNVGQPSEP